MAYEQHRKARKARRLMTGEVEEVFLHDQGVCLRLGMLSEAQDERGMHLLLAHSWVDEESE